MKEFNFESYSTQEDRDQAFTSLIQGDLFPSWFVEYKNLSYYERREFMSDLNKSFNLLAIIDPKYHEIYLDEFVNKFSNNADKMEYIPTDKAKDKAKQYTPDEERRKRGMQDPEIQKIM